MTKTPLTDAINDSMVYSTYYHLFKHMADNHDLVLLETELSDIVNVVNSMHPINWDALMDKFFKEHTELKDGVPKICSMPMAIFNWFKNNVK